MSGLPVRYLSLHPEQPGRGFWDQHVLDAVLVTDDEADGLGDLADGAVVVLPGRMHYDAEDAVTEALSGLAWVVLVVTGDEESRFDRDRVLRLPERSVRYVQTPSRGQLDRGDRWLPLGPSPAAELVEPRPFTDRPYAWSFAGQITHGRRTAMLAAVDGLRGGLTATTDRFAAGLSPVAYAEALACARFVPCPSGPVHVETFRAYEALAAGAIPVVDEETPNGDDWAWYWDVVGMPVPRVRDWRDLVPMLDQPDGQHRANVAGAWWVNTQARLASEVQAEATALAGRRFGSRLDDVTVIVTMSPIPSHPSLEVLAETLNSLAAFSNVVVAVDGCAPMHDGWRAAYEEATRRLVASAASDLRAGRRLRVVVADGWEHQANMVRRALALVTTPYVLLAEHDTPLVREDEVPWEGILGVLDDGDANLVRLHHEDRVLDEHRHLMVGDGPVELRGANLWRTIQFSARPHVAGADWYRAIIDEFFPPSARTFTEDRLHTEFEHRPWEWGKMMLFTPDGGTKRSTHLDGRAGAEKAPALFS